MALSETIATEMRWTKLNKRGQVTSIQDKHPGDGVWFSSFTLPFTDGQTTIFYWSIDGVIMPPKICHHGHARHLAMQIAIDDAKDHFNKGPLLT